MIIQEHRHITNSDLNLCLNTCSCYPCTSFCLVLCRRKLMIRLAQVEEELSTALSKNGSLEKTKARLTGEVEDLQLDLERVSSIFHADHSHSISQEPLEVVS